MADETTQAPAFRLFGARAVADAAPKAFVIAHQIEAIELNLEPQPEIAIDTCRSLIESVCRTILSDLSEPLPPKPNSENLVALVLKRLALFADPKSVDAEAKDAVGDTVTGINKLVNGIGKYRRVFGIASHGRDGYREAVDGCHARLVAGVTDALVAFLYEAHRRLHGEEEWHRAYYGDHPEFDQYLDDEHDPSPIVVFGDEHPPSEVLFGVNQTGYVKRLNDWKKMRAAGEVETEEDE